MHESPSQGFVEACLELKKGIAFLDAYYEKNIGHFKSYINNFEEISNQTKKFYSQTEKLLKPFEYYLSIIKSTSQKRINIPDLETLFIGQDLTTEKFLQISSSIAEHCIIQEKDNTSATLEIIGTYHSLAASPDHDEIGWFYVLCSTIHFIQQHFTNDGTIVKTSNLRAKKCPFSGVCAVERSEGYPETCVTYPWKFKTKNQEGLCWYSAGIRSITPIQSNIT